MKTIFLIIAFLTVLSFSSNAQISLPGYHSYKEKDDEGSQVTHITNGKVRITYIAVGRDIPYDIGSDSARMAGLETTFGDRHYKQKGYVYYGTDTIFNKDHYCFYAYYIGREVEIIVVSAHKDAAFRKACDLVINTYSTKR